MINRCEIGAVLDDWGYVSGTVVSMKGVYNDVWCSIHITINPLVAIKNQDGGNLRFNNMLYSCIIEDKIGSES